jgi:hypothetical protein
MRENSGWPSRDCFTARNQDIVDFLVVEVAQRPLDQRAFLVDQSRRLRLQRHVAHRLPHPDQVFEVALDFGFCARCARGAQDDAHALGHIEVLNDFFQPRAVLGGSDLAADAAAAGGIGHQHRIAAGEREVGGQRRALAAALFLDDLHQHDLAAFDDFLNLVLAARAEGAFRHFLHHIVATDGFDDLFLGLIALVIFVKFFAVSRRMRFIGWSGLGFMGIGGMCSVFGGDFVPIGLAVGMMVFVRVVLVFAFLGSFLQRLGNIGDSGYGLGRRRFGDMLVALGLHVVIMMMVVIMRMLVVVMIVMMRRFIVMAGSLVVMGAIMSVFSVMFVGVRVKWWQPLCRRLGTRLDDLALNPLAMAAPA